VDAEGKDGTEAGTGCVSWAGKGGGGCQENAGGAWGEGDRGCVGGIVGSLGPGGGLEEGER
jgi:hypothetical protein